MGIGSICDGDGWIVEWKGALHPPTNYSFVGVAKQLRHEGCGTNLPDSVGARVDSSIGPTVGACVSVVTWEPRGRWRGLLLLKTEPKADTRQPTTVAANQRTKVAISFCHTNTSLTNTHQSSLFTPR